MPGGGQAITKYVFRIEVEDVAAMKKAEDIRKVFAEALVGGSKDAGIVKYANAQQLALENLNAAITSNTYRWGYNLKRLKEVEGGWESLYDQYVATIGKFKDVGDPFKPLVDSAQAAYDKIIGHSIIDDLCNDTERRLRSLSDDIAKMGIFDSLPKQLQLAFTEMQRREIQLGDELKKLYKVQFEIALLADRPGARTAGTFQYQGAPYRYNAAFQGESGTTLIAVAASSAEGRLAAFGSAAEETTVKLTLLKDVAYELREPLSRLGGFLEDISFVTKYLYGMVSSSGLQTPPRAYYTPSNRDISIIDPSEAKFSLAHEIGHAMMDVLARIGDETLRGIQQLHLDTSIATVLSTIISSGMGSLTAGSIAVLVSRRVEEDLANAIARALVDGVQGAGSQIIAAFQSLNPAQVANAGGLPRIGSRYGAVPSEEVFNRIAESAHRLSLGLDGTSQSAKELMSTIESVAAMLGNAYKPGFEGWNPGRASLGIDTAQLEASAGKAAEIIEGEFRMIGPQIAGYLAAAASTQPFQPLVDDAQRASDEIVGESIIPDMVARIQAWMAQLTNSIAQPFMNATIPAGTFANAMNAAMGSTKQAVVSVGQAAQGSTGKVLDFNDALNLASRQYFGLRRVGFGLSYVGAQVKRVGQQVLDALSAAGDAYLTMDRKIATIGGRMGMSPALEQELRDKMYAVSEEVGFIKPEDMATGYLQWAEATNTVTKSHDALIKSLREYEEVAKLAAMHGEDVGTVAEVVGEILSDYNMNISETARITKLLNFVAANSTASVSQIGEAFAAVGPIAKTMNTSIEETVAIIGIMAQAGIKGSKAGTILRDMYEQMLEPTKDFNKAMNAVLGKVGTTEIWKKFVFPKGEFIGWAKFFDLVAAGTEKMTGAQRQELYAMMSTNKEMVGLTDVVNIVINGREKGISVIRAYETAMTDAGAAEVKVYNDMVREASGGVGILQNALDQWNQQWSEFEKHDAKTAESIKNHWDSVKSKFGEIFEKTLLPLLARLLDKLDDLAGWAEENPWAVELLAGGAGAAVVGGGLLQGIGTLLGGLASLKTLKLASDLVAASKVGAAGGAAGAAAARYPLLGTGIGLTGLVAALTGVQYVFEKHVVPAIEKAISFTPAQREVSAAVRRDMFERVPGGALVTAITDALGITKKVDFWEAWDKATKTAADSTATLGKNADTAGGILYTLSKYLGDAVTAVGDFIGGIRDTIARWLGIKTTEAPTGTFTTPQYKVLGVDVTGIVNKVFGDPGAVVKSELTKLGKSAGDAVRSLNLLPDTADKMKEYDQVVSDTTEAMREHKDMIRSQLGQQYYGPLPGGLAPSQEHGPLIDYSEAFDAYQKYLDDMEEATKDHLEQEKEMDEEYHESIVEYTTDRIDQRLDLIDEENERVAEMQQDHLDREAEALEDHLDREEEMLEDHYDRRAEMLEDFIDRENEYYEDHLDQEKEIRENYAEAEIEAKQEFEDQKLENEQESRERLTELYEDYLKDIARMRRDYVDKLWDLVAARDARGILNAMRDYKNKKKDRYEDYLDAVAKEKKKTDDLAKEYAKQEAKRLKQLNKELADLDKHYEKEKAKRAANFAKQLAELDEQFAKSQAKEDEAFAKRMVKLDENNVKQIAKELHNFNDRMAKYDEQTEDELRHMDARQKKALAKLDKNHEEYLAKLKTEAQEEINAMIDVLEGVEAAEDANYDARLKALATFLGRSLAMYEDTYGKIAGVTTGAGAGQTPGIAGAGGYGTAAAGGGGGGGGGGGAGGGTTSTGAGIAGGGAANTGSQVVIPTPAAAVNKLVPKVPTHIAGGSTAFVTQLAAYAKAIESQYKIPALAMLAIAANDTGWGQYCNNYNLFGIKGYGPAGGFSTITNEEVAGAMVPENAVFRAYNNWAEAFADFAKLISTSSRYSSAVGVMDVTKFTSILKSGGYATDSRWVTKVATLATQIKTIMDKLKNLATGGIAGHGLYELGENGPEMVIPSPITKWLIRAARERIADSPDVFETIRSNRATRAQGPVSIVVRQDGWRFTGMMTDADKAWYRQAAQDAAYLAIEEVMT